MSVPSHELNGFHRLSSDWVIGPKTEAGDSECGREEERVRMEEERAGLLPGFNITEPHHHPRIRPSLHHITMSLHTVQSVPAVITLALMFSLHL